jgi:hypothetical protein
MGYRGSKSVIGLSLHRPITVKEQRVDGSSVSLHIDTVRCTLVAGKPVIDRKKYPLSGFIFYWLYDYLY